MNKRYIRLIFGLKVRQHRKERGLSFKELAQLSGISVSYLNEIEKGKKYPKEDKIAELARVLNVSYDNLVSLKLPQKLTPIAELLRSNILENIPLEMFGLELHRVLELVAQTPVKVGAFINTIVKIARSYEMSQDHFYFAALRSYQEMHGNYFENIESAVHEFMRQYQLPIFPPQNPETLVQILISDYGYQIDRDYLVQQPDLQHFRSVFVPDKKCLYINNNLTPTQQAFLFGKEIAFNFLALAERPYTSSLFQVNSFEEVLNNFKAAYFSVALLINRKLLLADLQSFFQEESWNSEIFLNMLEKHAASPEMFLHRLTNLLPRYFELDHLFFFRMNDELYHNSPFYTISKELHLSRLHAPYMNSLSENYCRRWESTRILQRMRNGNNKPTSIGVQRLSYVNTKLEYLCISLAKPNIPSPNSNVSLTLGISVNQQARKKIRFLKQENIPSSQVGVTCERCPISDCKERAAPAVLVQQQQKQAQISSALKQLFLKV